MTQGPIQRHFYQLSFALFCFTSVILIAITGYVAATVENTADEVLTNADRIQVSADIVEDNQAVINEIQGEVIAGVEIARFLDCLVVFALVNDLSEADVVMLATDCGLSDERVERLRTLYEQAVALE